MLREGFSSQTTGGFIRPVRPTVVKGLGPRILRFVLGVADRQGSSRMALGASNQMLDHLLSMDPITSISFSIF